MFICAGRNIRAPNKNADFNAKTRFSREGLERHDQEDHIPIYPEAIVPK
jgi:hypothetical protein